MVCLINSNQKHNLPKLETKEFANLFENSSRTYNSKKYWLSEQEIREFLNNCNLGQYADVLIEEGFDQMKSVRSSNFFYFVICQSENQIAAKLCLKTFRNIIQQPGPDHRRLPHGLRRDLGAAGRQGHRPIGDDGRQPHG